jgi:hypothetical protein
VVAEEAQTAEALKPTPFVTVPPERLAEKGYVEARADTVLFHGPDAEVLLSDAFLDAHCFQARAGGRGNPGQVGLAFAPAGERAIAGLRGVLWLDAATAELRTLEYEYVWRELPRASEAGGRVEFRRLPTGAWIVSRWRIRMPSGALRFRALGVTSPGLFPRVARVTEESGEVLEVRTAEGAEVSMTARAGVAGVVWDSTRARPLAGARVYLAGTGREARSDSAGRFALEGVPEGAYSLAFEHPRLDSLRFTPEPVRVVAVPPRTSRADLALPPLGAVLTAACPARADAGALGGQVREAGTGRLLARVPVRASWLRPGESGDTARALAVSDDAGAYRFCALPAGVPVRVAAALPGAAEAEVRLEPGRPAVHALEIPGRGETAGDALPGRVALRVVDEATSRPLAGVTVRFGGAIPDAVSDRRGMVRLADVPAGSYGVELRHDTYGAGTARVAVRGGLPTELEIRLPRRAVTLEPLVVQARRVAPGALDAGRGRRMNMVTRDEIDQRPAARNVGELVARFPGLRLRYDDRGDICLESMREVATRLSSLGVCNGLQLFLDDLPVGQGMEFATSIPMNTVESVVVLNPTEAFGLYGFMAHRGALLVYTRGNGPTMRRRR